MFSEPMTTEITLLSRALVALQDRVEELAAQVAALHGDDQPTLREMLLAWPHGMQALAAEVGTNRSSMSDFALAKNNHFPVVLAAQVEAFFDQQGIEVFGEPVTMERLRRAWARAKREGTK